MVSIQSQTFNEHIKKINSPLSNYVKHVKMQNGKITGIALLINK